MYPTKDSWDTSLSCDTDQTWTPDSAGNETRPVSCVNWYQAAAFCIWDGGFLPSEAEWNYAAAGGAAQRQFPWSVAASISCTNAHYNGCDPREPINVGTLPAGDGLYGHSDLSGNIAEWTLDWYSDYGTPCDNCTNATPVMTRVRRGGNFNLSGGNAVTTSRANFPPDSSVPGGGLRCARTP